MSIPRRTQRDRVFMQVAQSLSQLSTCDRAHVGAVFVRQGRCITWGYNGAPPGLPHCEDNHHGWADRLMGRTFLVAPNFYVSVDELDVRPTGQKWEAYMEAAAQKWGCRNVTHAEANALSFAAKQGISTEGATLYVTVSPCLDCSRLLLAAGIERVCYLEQYRDTSGLDLLQQALIDTQLIPYGLEDEVRQPA